MIDSVVVVGAINVDFSVHVEALPGPGETVLGPRVERSGGGKGANAAVAAARLGGSVFMIGAVGEDELGESALDELRSEGVNTDCVTRRATAATGMALIVVDTNGQNQIAVGAGANLELSPETVADDLGELLPSCGCVLVSLEIPDQSAEVALRMAHDAGVISVLNPAPARPSVHGMLRWSPVATPNLGEARRLTGRASAGEAGAIVAAAAGRSSVITMGRGGALICHPDGGTTEIAPPKDVLARDTTGAGDTFNGALSAAVAQGESLDAATAHAVRAASLAVTAEGARLGMPTASDLERRGRS